MSHLKISRINETEKLCEIVKQYIWDDDIDIYSNLNTHKKGYLLNINHNSNDKQFDLLEKYIYDQASYKLYELGKTINDENISIEFWIKNNVSYVNENKKTNDGVFHIDKDEKTYSKHGILITPILSNITYLNDCDIPLVYTDIPPNPYEDYVNSINKKEHIWQLAFPKKYTSISFTNMTYHASLDILEKCNINDNVIRRYIIVYNIFENHIPVGIGYYNTKYKKEYSKQDVIFTNTEISYDVNEYVIYNPPERIESIKNILQERFMFDKDYVDNELKNEVRKHVVNLKINYDNTNQEVKEYDSMLSRNLLNLCIREANINLENGIYDYTNYDRWEKNIINDGSIIYVKNIERDSILYRRLCNEIQEKINIPTEGIKLMYHMMGDGSNVGLHDDGHVDYALTIYLNDKWNKKDGGIFYYYLNDKEYEVVPCKNKGVFIKNTEHRVSEIKNNKIRVSIQGFYSEDICYKNKKINVIIN